MPQSWRNFELKSSPELATSRAGGASVVFDDIIYLIGGRKGRAFYGDVLALNTRKGSRVAWELISEATPGFSPRAGHTATLVKNEIWVIGGSNNETIFGDVSVFDLGKRTWRFPMPK